MLDVAVREALARARGGRVLVLTGAGISAESGIPTFRGPEGYWKVGSRNYHPQELARLSAFEEMPWALWSWYLYRRSICRAAEPNAAHRALVELEQKLADRFVLVTQNVDGLHLRAGNMRSRTFQVHGNVDFMRCTKGCTVHERDLIPFPESLPSTWEKDREVGESEKAHLRCPKCEALTRPHVLWFDEYYDEELFKAHSSMISAQECDLLVVVGTTLQTSLPARIVERVTDRQKPIFAVDVEPSELHTIARGTGGAGIVARAGEALPEIVSALTT